MAGMLFRLIAALLAPLLLLALPHSAQAQDPSLEGSWALMADDTIIFRFDLRPQPGGEWAATWLRPDSFGSDGEVFVKLRGPVERIESMAGLELAGEVELSFPDPRPNAVPDIFRFALMSADRAQMQYVGTGLAPYDMVRVTRNSPPGPWDYERTYRRTAPATAAVDADGFDLGETGAAADTGDAAPANRDGQEEPPTSRLGSDFLDGL